LVGLGRLELPTSSLSVLADAEFSGALTLVLMVASVGSARVMAGGVAVSAAVTCHLAALG